MCYDAFLAGYKKVALNHTVARLNKAETANFIAIAEEARNNFEKKEAEGKIKSKDESQHLYTRLTLSLTGRDDSGQIFSSNSPLLQAYDILAVAPSDFKTFQTACSLEVDIIVIPATSYTSYIRHAVIKSALDRGVHFEISLGPYLRNPELRSNFFACGTALMTSTGGKNLLLTNGAEKGIEVRGAYDLANLASLLGVDFGIAKSALSVAPFSILQRCIARRSAKGVLRVLDLDSSAQESRAGSAKGKSQTTSSSTALPEFIPLGDDAAPPLQMAAASKRKKRKAGEQL